MGDLGPSKYELDSRNDVWFVCKYLVCICIYQPYAIPESAKGVCSHLTAFRNISVPSPTDCSECRHEVHDNSEKKYHKDHFIWDNITVME